jgi:tRNA (cytidine/uridine-2'-O-)-methyltransferase
MSSLAEDLDDRYSPAIRRCYGGLMRLALYQPDIPQNAGSLIRLGACLGVPVDVIEPCGFPFSARDLRRVALDYIDLADVVRHPSFEAFAASNADRRLVLLTTKAELAPSAFRFRPDDVLMVGRESVGVPEPVHGRADARLRIPMVPGARSLNVALAAAMALAEALRQIGRFPLPAERAA